MSYQESEHMKTLFGMLETCRPKGTKSERRFIKQFIIPLGVVSDRAGNLYKKIGKAPIVWSAHTDTVHERGGSQITAMDGDELALATVANSNCLGADNGAGVWLLTEMIKAKKEGLYIFHRGEESGGIGSTFISEKTPELVNTYQAAIAFDRRGKSSIITHQRGGRKCSETFSNSLGKLLGLGHKSDNTGTFTDTANYSDLIGECTNVSVGFSNEHTEFERLNTKYINMLRESLLDLDTSKLEFERKPGEKEPYVARTYGFYDEFDRWEHSNSNYASDGLKGTPWVKPTGKPFRQAKTFDLTDDYDQMEGQDLQMLCKKYPDYVADYLESFGITSDELMQHIIQCES